MEWGGGGRGAACLRLSATKHSPVSIRRWLGSPMAEDAGLPDHPQALAQLAPKQGQLR